jgi:branched-chain amino acid transport system permease protein
MLSVGAIVALFTATAFGQELLAKVAIFAIFAVSLDFLVGYVGLVSLGQAGLLGTGAYAYAYCAAILNWPTLPSVGIALLFGAAVAFVLGIFAVRVGGIFFMMVTLALSMMIYSVAAKSRTFNGDDGLSGIPRLDLSALGIDLSDGRAFCALVIGLLVTVLLAFELLVRSPFGQTLVAIRQNESRMRALGCPVQRYKLAAFTIAGAVSALAGSLMVQQDSFVSPELTYWVVSGEALIIVIIGGAGTLLGPILGSAIVLLFRDTISSLTQYSAFWTGILFVVVVMIAPDGLYGRAKSIAAKLNWRANRA